MAKIRSTVLGVLGVLICCGAAAAQEGAVDSTARLLLNSEIGSETQLGYKFPSTSFGPSVEIPLTRHFELQGDAEYSPDKKVATNDGREFHADTGLIGWAAPSVGVIGNFERSWVWTSQFDKAPVLPSAGIVLRTRYLRPGRLYATYLFPTGCVWATASDPCKIQSNRLQGLQVRQEFRALAHFRLALGGGMYHFCDQGNPNEAQAGRTCHFGATMFTMGTFEFHVGRRPDSDASYNSAY